MGRSIRHTFELREFLTSPVGAVLAGDSFVFANLGSLCGWRVWGTPSLAEAQDLIAALGTAYAPGTRPYWSLVDLRELEQVDGAGFEVLRSFVEAHREQMATHLVRQAVVKPEGLVGALAAGFYVQLVPRHQVRVFSKLDAAARWLRPPAREALRQLIAVFEEPPVRASLVGPLQRWLGAHLEAPTPSGAARGLGVSVRTLQRRLTAEGTSFRDQVRGARVERARGLLLDSTGKLAAVAQEAGFSSSQQLATVFREVVGLTPSEFRRRQPRARLRARRDR